MIELVVILVIIGITSVVLIPRLGPGPFYERGFYDEVASAARYARTLAVTSGCEVQLGISGNAYVLNQRVTDCTTGAFNKAVIHPGGRADVFSGSAPEGITLTMTDNTPNNPVVFKALGNTADQIDRTVTVSSKSFTIIGATGFVRAP